MCLLSGAENMHKEGGESQDFNTFGNTELEDRDICYKMFFKMEMKGLKSKFFLYFLEY